MRQVPTTPQAQLILTGIHRWIQAKGYAPGIVNTNPEWHYRQVSALRSEVIQSEFTVGDSIIYKLLFLGDLEDVYVKVFDIEGNLQQALTDELNGLIQSYMSTQT